MDARPKKAPVAQVAMMLWPHPWPMPRRASYSARNEILGPGALPFFTARKEVSMPQ